MKCARKNKAIYFIFPSDFSLKNTDCLLIYIRLITYGSSGLRRQTAGGPAATNVPAAMSLLGLSESNILFKFLAKF
jgi:hypothetical protein